MDQVEPSAIDDVWVFLLSVDWTDPWLIALVIAHIGVTLTALLTRKHSCLQALLFLTLLSLVFFSNNINELAARNWRYFSRQQYFDNQGKFLSVIFSAPLLLDCLIMVLNWVHQSGDMMVYIKRAQLKGKLKERNNNGADKCARECGDTTHRLNILHTGGRVCEAARINLLRRLNRSRRLSEKLQ